MGAISRLYLTVYNSACLATWSYISYKIAAHYANDGKPETLWPEVEQPLKAVQTAAILEVAHAATGLVRSGVATTFIQVLSRVGVLWAVTNLAPPAQQSIFFTLMCGAWSLAELPRYSMYLLGNFGVEEAAMPYALKWIRYSHFLVLYPCGILGELGNIWTAMPYVKEHGVWSVTLPNNHNLAYNHYLVMWLMIAAYVPGSPTMMGHMLTQRAKKVGAKAGAEAAAAAVAPASANKKTKTHTN